jgi:hypothetical protein
VPDTLADGDVVLLELDQLPPLIGSPQMAADATGGILHYHALADERYGGAALVLLRPRAGTPRPQWTPEKKSKSAPARDLRGVFRRRVVAAPTTSTPQGASL